MTSSRILVFFGFFVSCEAILYYVVQRSIRKCVERKLEIDLDFLCIFTLMIKWFFFTPHSFVNFRVEFRKRGWFPLLNRCPFFARQVNVRMWFLCVWFKGCVFWWCLYILEDTCMAINWVHFRCMAEMRFLGHIFRDTSIIVQQQQKIKEFSHNSPQFHSIVTLTEYRMSVPDVFDEKTNVILLDDEGIRC